MKEHPLYWIDPLWLEPLPPPKTETYILVKTHIGNLLAA